MNKLLADPPDIEERRRNHLQRNEAAKNVLGVDNPQIQKRLPGSNAKIKAVDDWLISDDYDPEIGELIVGDRSVQGSCKVASFSIDQAKRAMQKDYGPRDELLKAIALKFDQQKPCYLGNRNNAIRDHIIEALECLDRGSGASKLDNWFGDKELYNEEALKRFRNKKTGELISAKTIGNLLSALK